MNRPPEETLRGLLRRVHERLSRADRVDPESRHLLGTLTQDIERALGAEEQPPRLEGDSLPRLEALAVRFDVGHPALAQALRQLIYALVKAGI